MLLTLKYKAIWGLRRATWETLPEWSYRIRRVPQFPAHQGKGILTPMSVNPLDQMGAPMNTSALPVSEF